MIKLLPIVLGLALGSFAAVLYANGQGKTKTDIIRPDVPTPNPRPAFIEPPAISATQLPAAATAPQPQPQPAPQITVEASPPGKELDHSYLAWAWTVLTTAITVLLGKHVFWPASLRVIHQGDAAPVLKPSTSTQLISVPPAPLTPHGEQLLLQQIYELMQRQKQQQRGSVG
jgi:hypothetical protein